MKRLYSRLKVFHFKEKINSLPMAASEILAPVHVRIKPTNACNHRCSYCAYRLDELKLGEDMRISDSIPREKMNEIVQDLISMGVKAVTFSGGGEPFCYPFLLEVAQRLAQSSIEFASLTNGSLLKGEVANIFAQHAAWVRISMDGWDDASYARYRGVPEGEFSKVLANIDAFRSLGGECFLGVVIVTNRENASHVHELVGRIKNCGAHSVKIAPCIVSTRGSENNAYHKPVFELVKEQIEKAKVDFSSDDFEIVDSYHVQLESFAKEYSWCPYIQIRPVIGADLNVYSCQDKAYDLNEGLIGSIKDQSFMSFWHKDKSKFFKINPSRLCNHHCVAHENNQFIHEYLDLDMKHVNFV